MSHLIAIIFLIVLTGQLSLCLQQQHPCKRKCNGKTLTCNYDFTLDLYASMSTNCGKCPLNVTDCFRDGCVPAEGRKKGLYLVNNLLPGPAVEVCKGDRIVVDLHNELQLETTSIHWHGIRQKNTPFMDGVPYLTQCPVAPGHSFKYDFVVEQPGTYLWHSHSSQQRGEGMFGALIVRSNDEPQSLLYDHDEHVVTITDWTRITGSETLAIDVHAAELVRPHTLLINGIGRYDGRYMPMTDKKQKKMPVPVFNVQKGSKHRFRLIHAGVQDCPVHVSIDNHTMLVIATDAQDIQPVEVDSLRILSGERYDVVVTIDERVDNYWIRFRSKDGSESACDVTGAHQVAILRYKGAADVDPISPVTAEIIKDPSKRLLNPYDKGTESENALTIPLLNALVEDDETSRDQVDYQFYLTYNDVDADEVAKRKTRRAMWQINDINFKSPTFPPLTQPEMIKDGMFCNADTLKGKNCSMNFCACTHALQAKMNSLVELVLVDRGARYFNHPLHLHGYHFRVVAMEKLNSSGIIDIDELKEMDAQGKIYRKLQSAPLKDTVMVPSGGYTIVRFYTDNPGYWLFHCHYEMHVDVGMALAIKVGEHHDFPPIPRGFPRCGNSE